MLANPSKIAEETVSPKLFPEAEANGWGSNMIEAYTGHHICHGASRKRLQVIAAPKDARLASAQGSTGVNQDRGMCEEKRTDDRPAESGVVMKHAGICEGSVQKLRFHL
jgi:hypothetical protein